MIGNSFFFGGGFEVLFFMMFILVFGVIIVNIIKGIGQWNKNNQSPRLTVLSKVVSKRTAVSHEHHHNAGDITGAHGSYMTTSTTYYATFQVGSGDRLEFQINGSEYGRLAEGDNGRLSFQGTRYIGFERQ
ncbi:DUF2500 domain-containing protein [Clostridium aminobutyricum]|uniref:DUF2500 domain-containing protein n=1 Tax=Clostridium aminobutyricum TaxID=33953 RepID=A0A939IG04_CLOAM|nr:DUF2500 domain-containing protein [Clostridium aminobutyricum]MBN7772315.1 DUF2500 domain-containing protein [Clostridium aminobutyricum]